MPYFTDLASFKSCPLIDNLLRFALERLIENWILPPELEKLIMPPLPTVKIGFECNALGTVFPSNTATLHLLAPLAETVLY